MSGKVSVDIGVCECSLVYDIVNAIELLHTMIGNRYPSILKDEILMTNEVLKEKFGRYFNEYSKEEVDNLVAEYILLNKELKYVK